MAESAVPPVTPGRKQKAWELPWSHRDPIVGVDVTVVSVWSPDGTTRRAQPDYAEREAVRLIRGVGEPDREWWWWNAAALVGHLRVPITPSENEQIPPGCVVADAGESGPLRSRTR